MSKWREWFTDGVAQIAKEPCDWWEKTFHVVEVGALKELEQENARLRKALERIRDMAHTMRWTEARDKAREALEGEKK